MRDLLMPEIKTITPSDQSAWDSYVVSHEQGGPYLAYSWKKAVETAYGHKTVYLASYTGNTISGVLPLVYIKPPFFSGRLVSLPFCDYGGILAQNHETADALLHHAKNLAATIRAELEIRCPGSCPAIEKQKGFIRVTNKSRMILELPGSANRLWTGFKSKLRSQVKRPAKDGLVARIGGKNFKNEFYPVFSANMRDLGSPVHSGKWIDSVMDAFGEKARIGVVFKNGLPVAAGILLFYKNTATVPWASTLREYNHFSPNMLLYWSFLEYASDSGYRLFDFGRSTPGEGTYAFKKQWGAMPTPLFWYRSGGGDIYPKNHAGKDGPWRQAAVRTWQRLPIVVTNAMGPCLRKYIDR